MDGEQYYVHADRGYNGWDVVDVPLQSAKLTAGKRRADKITSSVRVTVEWSYKEVKFYWTVVYFKRSIGAGESAVRIIFFIATEKLHNIRNCVYPNTVSQYFTYLPSSLEEYISHKN